jgi:hypothetical protein
MDRNQRSASHLAASPALSPSRGIGSDHEAGSMLASIAAVLLIISRPVDSSGSTKA